MKGGLLLDVVVAQRAAILKLLSGKDQALLIWGDSFLVLKKIIIVKKSNANKTKINNNNNNYNYNK